MWKKMLLGGMFFALSTAFLLQGGVALAQSKTQKLSKKLVERAEDTIKEIEKTQEQLEKTVKKYNEMLGKQKAKDVQKEYKNLSNELKKTEDRVKELRKKDDDMEKDAKKFFAEWSKGLGGINDDKLRSMSEMRLNETREGYYKIIDAGKKAGDQYQAFITDLGNQINFLEFDTSDAAVSELRATSVETHARAKSLFNSIDELTVATKSYIKSLQ